MKNAIRLLIVAVAFGASTYLVSAQDQGQGGRRNFDPQQFRERMMERMKEDLNANDQEWKVIEPLLDKVMTAQRESSMGRFGGMMGMRRPQGRGGQDRGGADAQQGDRRGGPQDRMGGAPPEVEALRAAVESDKTPAADLKAKMAAVRQARAKGEADLKKAREDLRKVLTVRQEAQLMLMGMLD